MPWHLYCLGRSPPPAAGLSATEAEWKLFQHLRRSAGGLSGLLLFQFCLTLYVVLWEGTQITTATNATTMSSAPSSSPSSNLNYYSHVSCPWVAPWMLSYTTVLFLFRALHEIALLWWRGGAMRGRKTRTWQQQQQQQQQRSSRARNGDDDWRLYTGVRLYMWVHIAALPAASVLVAVGFVLLPSTPASCAPRDIYTLQYIFLALAVPVLCIKAMLHYQYVKRDIFLFLARTDMERFVSRALSPQFLSDMDGESGSGRDPSVTSAWTITFPITSSVGPPAKCVICLDDVLAGDKIRDFPCRHSFHVCCIDRWLRDHDTCPSCKEVVKRSTPLEDFQQLAREARRMRPSTRVETAEGEGGGEGGGGGGGGWTGDADNSGRGVESVEVLEIELDLNVA
jgi:hypothetical protein